MNDPMNTDTTAPLDGPSTATSSSTSTIVIRHAGKAHIRGRIRRVWRPRYLELTSDGRLQYYEYSNESVTSSDTEAPPPPPPPPQQTSTRQNAHKVLKYTLIVSAARILDVTTIRDLHTGLMRGSFGFLIRARRLVEDDDDDVEDVVAAASPTPDETRASSGAGGTEPGTGAAPGDRDVLVLDTPLAASFMLAADESLDQGDNAAVAGVVGGTLGATLPPQPVRDYLCAVPTLEQAQMWVVALDWAAKHNSATLPPAQPPLNLLSQSAGTTPAAAADQWWKVDYFTTPKQAPPAATVPAVSTTGSSIQSAGQSGSASKDIPSIPTSSVQSPSSLSTVTTTAPVAAATASSSSIRKGKILVTAVTNYTIIRWTKWTLEIAYEIDAMLLYDSVSHQNDATRTGDTAKLTTFAEQWSVRRTASQFEKLVHDLKVKPTSTGNGDSDDMRVIRQLPQWSQRPTAAQVDQSLSIVDSLVRSWVLSAEVANTAALKQFLGLNTDHRNAGTDDIEPTSTISSTSSVPQKFPCWQVHCDNPFAVTEPKVRQSVPADRTKESYVKEWLLRVRSGGRGKGSTLGPPQWLIQFRHDQTKYLLSAGGVVVATSVAPSMYRLWQRLMPVTPVRWDVLVASWAGASYLGYWFGNGGNNNHGGKSMKQSTSRHSLVKGGVVQRKPVKQSAALIRHHSEGAKIRGMVGPNAPSAPSVDKRSKEAAVLQPSTRVPSLLAGSGQQVASHSSVNTIKDDSTATVVVSHNDDSVDDDFADFASTGSRELFDVVVGNDVDDDESDGDVPESSDDDGLGNNGGTDDELSKSADLAPNLSSPLPQYPDNGGLSCWSQPRHDIFHVRGAQYFTNKVKVCSGPAPLQCRGVDIWLTDNPERHIARNPAVLGGKLGEKDTFLVNFLLPFGNFVSYFAIPPLRDFPDKLGAVWTKFLKGDQEYRDARLKLLPVVVDGPWIVKTAVGPGKSPALLGKVIPLQYYFRDPDGKRKGVYEVDVIITASSIAKGILSIVKSQTKSVSIAFAFIIEAAEQSELPETVLCCFQVHSLHLEDCPTLPKLDQDDGYE